MSFRSSKCKENARKRWKPTLKREVFDQRTSCKLHLKNLTHTLLNMTLCCCSQSYAAIWDVQPISCEPFTLFVYLCQSFETLCEAFPIINFTKDPLRSFIQSCTLPRDPLRSLLLPFEIFSGFIIHIHYYAGFSIMPPRVLASGPNLCGGNYPLSLNF